MQQEKFYYSTIKNRKGEDVTYKKKYYVNNKPVGRPRKTKKVVLKNNQEDIQNFFVSFEK